MAGACRNGYRRRMSDIFQKSIVILDLDPAKGREQKGVRPAVVISGDAFNNSGTAIICPVTTVIKKYAGDIILKSSRVSGLDELSEVLVGQVRVVSTERIVRKIGKITDAELTAIFEGLDLLCGR